MSNYYTPDISEFHVDFEYEEEDTIYTDKGWYTKKSNIFKKCIYGNDSYIQNYYLNERIKRNLFVNKVRVKYLDRQDIEELGFIQNTFIDGSTSETHISASLKNNDIEIYLGYSPETYRLNIRKYIPEFSKYLDRIDYKCEPLFNGFIKNKSELKTLLKQLNINEK